MRKRILEGIAGISLLAVLPACSSRKQSTFSDVYATANRVQTEVETVVVPTSEQPARRVLIPQWQVDAQSVYNRMLTYITPEEELALKIVEEKLAAYIDFPANSVQVNPKYGNNRAELAKLEERLKSLLRSGNGDVKKIRVIGYASPDGSTKENERLAGNRAIQFKNYLLGGRRLGWFATVDR